MRILALETSGFGGSVAALCDGQLISEQSLSQGERTAKGLAPLMQITLRDVGWLPSQVELIAVASGPGSFTGLRVGVTTAKMFAFAVGCQVLGVNTLGVIAWRMAAECRACSVAIDAQRQQVFAAKFARTGDGPLLPVGETTVLDDDAWLHGAAPGELLVGLALERLAQRVPPGVLVAPRDSWAPTAAAVGELAWFEHQQGRRDDPFQLVPQYFRRTAAEEQWERLGRK